ncbi:hypothetical protein DPMN_116566 [Dreissena polymorpha]|uniref:Alpha-macroglobulin receptor-binding domain-containing protein n=1 Tax=Dreissena polymorpha TaxID=45954 RepID=A0A9D4QTN5_DREPO|nr:hypothetical protein DPMN_116566 [Dreissena polymorpha]
MKEGASGMSVIEIGYPSGFSADPKSVSSHLLLKRVEEGDKKVILYLDEEHIVRIWIIFYFKNV